MACKEPRQQAVSSDTFLLMITQIQELSGAKITLFSSSLSKFHHAASLTLMAHLKEPVSLRRVLLSNKKCCKAVCNSTEQLVLCFRVGLE